MKPFCMSGISTDDSPAGVSAPEMRHADGGAVVDHAREDLTGLAQARGVVGVEVGLDERGDLVGRLIERRRLQASFLVQHGEDF